MAYVYTFGLVSASVEFQALEFPLIHFPEAGQIRSRQWPFARRDIHLDLLDVTYPWDDNGHRWMAQHEPQCSFREALYVSLD